MRYRDLHELIQGSQSSRAYVHSAAELRSRAAALQSWMRLTSLGGWDGRF